MYIEHILKKFLSLMMRTECSDHNFICLDWENPHRLSSGFAQLKPCIAPSLTPMLSAIEPVLLQ